MRSSLEPASSIHKIRLAGFRLYGPVFSTRLSPASWKTRTWSRHSRRMDRVCPTHGTAHRARAAKPWLHQTDKGRTIFPGIFSIPGVEETVFSSRETARVEAGNH